MLSHPQHNKTLELEPVVREAVFQKKPVQTGRSTFTDCAMMEPDQNDKSYEIMFSS